MLEDAELDLDVVHVLLPPDLHARAASTLIEHGIHVFLEKPMATTAKECSELIEQAMTHNVMVGVNHNFLFAPVYENLRNDLSSGKLGQPDHVTITWNRGLEQLQSGPFDLWMLRDPRNIMLEIGPHCVASMLDLVGPSRNHWSSNVQPGDSTRRSGILSPMERRGWAGTSCRLPLTCRSRPGLPSSSSMFVAAWRVRPSTLSGTPIYCTSTRGMGWISTAIG